MAEGDNDGGGGVMKGCCCWGGWVVDWNVLTLKFDRDDDDGSNGNIGTGWYRKQQLPLRI